MCTSTPFAFSPQPSPPQSHFLVAFAVLWLHCLTKLIRVYIRKALVPPLHSLSIPTHTLALFFFLTLTLHHHHHRSRLTSSEDEGTSNLKSCSPTTSISLENRFPRNSAFRSDCKTSIAPAKGGVARTGGGGMTNTTVPLGLLETSLAVFISGGP